MNLVIVKRSQNECVYIKKKCVLLPVHRDEEPAGQRAAVRDRVSPLGPSDDVRVVLQRCAVVS